MAIESATAELSPESASRVHPKSAGNPVSLLMGGAFWLTIGSLMGAVAAQWNHPMSAIVCGLPVVVLAAWLSRTQRVGFVVVGIMAAWILLRKPVANEPHGSSMLTFSTGLLILFSVGWLFGSLLIANQRVAHFARTEPLTGLLNRNAFLSRLEFELARSRRRGHPLAVAFLDCDHFKRLNDSRGHRVGDELLQAVADVLRAGTRRGDIVARMGGDEFALLYPEIPAEDAERIVHRLHEDLRHEMTERHDGLTVSIGLALFDRPPKSTNEVMDLADRLMYEAKGTGKDRIVSHVQSSAGREHRPDQAEQNLHRSG